MIKNTLVRVAAVAVSSGALIAGFTGVVGATQIGGVGGGTGPQSSNYVQHTTSLTTKATNNNAVGLSSANDQGSYSGSAYTTVNTTALGGTGSGATTNSNGAVTSLDISNGSGAGAGMGAAVVLPAEGNDTITNTGPYSDNSVVTDYHASSEVTNNNVVTISTVNSQHASSGDVVVSDNTTAGGAQSGSASNVSNTQTMLSIHN